MLLRELKAAGRRLARRPGYAALSIAVLGVGLGAVLFLFSLINTLMLHPLPLPQAGQRAPQAEGALVAALCCLPNTQATA